MARRGCKKGRWPSPSSWVSRGLQRHDPFDERRYPFSADRRRCTQSPLPRRHGLVKPQQLASTRKDRVTWQDSTNRLLAAGPSTRTVIYPGQPRRGRTLPMTINPRHPLAVGQHRCDKKGYLPLPKTRTTTLTTSESTSKSESCILRGAWHDEGPNQQLLVQACKETGRAFIAGHVCR